MVSELVLLLYIAYYHAVLVSGIDTAQIIYWGFVILAAPLLAALGAQLTYVAFAAKIEELKQDYRDFESSLEDEDGGEGGADDEKDATDKETRKMPQTKRRRHRQRLGRFFPALPFPGVILRVLRWYLSSPPCPAFGWRHGA